MGSAQQVLLGLGSATSGFGFGSEVPFTTGLILALEGDHVTGLVNNDPTGNWPDYSGNANHATSSGTNRPTYKTNQLNSLPGLDFDGTNSMNLTTSIDCDPVSIFAVLSRDTGDGPYTVIAGGTNCGQYRIYQGKANYLKASVADMGSETNTLTQDVFYVLGFTYSNPNLAFYKNGTADGTASSAQTLSNFNKVGEKGTEGEKYSGVICALLVYSSVLGSTDRGTVTSYLQSKYGL